MSTLTHGTVTANGVDFAYLAAGAPDAPLALCLHGFPDCASTWRHLLPRLADAGFRAVAPYQRGYAPTSIPADGLFQSGVLGIDANALHEALGGDDRAVIIGHDWGASGTYAAAALQPERWSKVVTLAVPTANAVPVAFLTDPEAVKRSWYMFFFQSPLSDLVVPANDLAFIDMLWRDWAPGYDASDDLPLVKASLGDPANLAATLGYYRATLGDGKKDPALDAAQAATQAVPTQPTLYLHGRNDGCISAGMAEYMAGVVPSHVTVEIVDDCGHFLHLERPDVVNGRILDFLA
ncbi:MAG: alpha/beta hydrolase [Actinomycetota bacterium]|nr:alpha/beta hydrolase [Actinomycetota bacterium]